MTEAAYSSKDSYRSIFLEDNWAHQKYYGWKVTRDLPGLRMLSKKRAVFTRNLILLSAGGRKELPGAVSRAAGRLGLADVVIHDFDGIFATAPCIDGRPFYRAADTERLLNIATFVIDLRQEENDLYAAMCSNYRRLVRRAEREGVQVEAYERPSDGMVVEFITAYKAFANERHISAPDVGVIRRMYAQGDALLFVARKGHSITNYLHVYVTDKIGFFMFGLNLMKESNGAGQYLQLQAMRQLKSRGLVWYDLGGVSSLDRSNGIYFFKKGFGGKLVLLGSEWRNVGQALSPLMVALATKRIARRIFCL